MGTIIALIVAWFVYQLTQKVDRLSQEVDRLKGQPLQSSVAVPPPPVAEGAVGDIHQAPLQQSGEPQSFIPRKVVDMPQPAGPSAFEVWIKKDFFVKLGAFFLLIALGWFVNYAFANDWIGPAGRVTLGLVIGVGIMALGAWRIRKYLHQGGIFIILGSSAVLMTVFAAQEVYDFFTPTTALGLMFMSVAFVAFVSVQYRSDKLALAGLVLAGIAPFLTNPPEFDVAVVFTYLMVVVLGTLWVVKLTGSRTLTFAALMLASAYSLPFWFDGVYGEDKIVGLLFAFVFTAIFFITNVLSVIHKDKESARQGHAYTAVLTGLYLISWIMGAAPEEWHSLLYIAWMLVFSSGAFVVYMRTTNRQPFYIYGAVGIGLLAAATAAELSGALLTIAYTIEAAAIVLVSQTLFRNNDLAEKLCALFLAPVIMSGEHLISREWRDGVLHEDFFALLILAGALCLTGMILFAARQADANENKTKMPELLGVAGIAYVLSLVWLVTHAVMASDVATMMSLVVYTISGIAFFVRGQREDDQALKTFGGILLGLVAVRLLFVDVWQMELVGRVITFAAVGVLLISTAFIGKHKTHLEE